MNQSERRHFLIQELKNEKKEYKDLQIPADTKGQKQLLRALLNVRLPRKCSRDFLEIQDAYLQEENTSRGIVNLEDLKPKQVHGKAALYLWQGDITRLACDAIVNAANSGMTGCYVPNHTCIDNCIHTFAGVELRLACEELMEEQGYEEPAGRAKITPAFNLPSRYVIHTVGPIVMGRVTGTDCELLASCYRSCLKMAEEQGLASIAFCCISTGVFHFPNERAAQIAVSAVKEYLEQNQESSVKQVVFNVFKEEDKEIYQSLLEEGESKSVGLQV